MRYQQIWFAIYQSFAVVIGSRKGFTQINCIFRTGFFAQTAEDTAQHIDLVFGCIFFFAVQVFFSLLAFGAFHGNGLCRAGYGAETAGGTTLTTFFIAVQHMQSAKYRAERPRLLGILYSGLSFKNMFKSDEHALENIPHVESLYECHGLALHRS